MHEAIDINIEVKGAALQVLRYYALFSYPLTAEEIQGSCAEICRLSTLTQALNELCAEGKIYNLGIFYSIQPNIEQLVERRKTGNNIARKKYAKAVKAGRIINTFPFVRFVGISGSISKGYAEPDSDFDFFIITAQNRLWICRTLLHIFKKITFLVNAQHKFCMNYFIDTSKLELDERNVFTATELASIIPLHGSGAYRQLIYKIAWVKSFFPNDYKPFIAINGIDDSNGLLKKGGEIILNMLKPRQLNKWLMNITDKRWRKKWTAKKYPMEDYDLAFKTTLHISKNHPANHQKRVLAKLAAIK